jgi:hypothetical protein
MLINSEICIGIHTVFIDIQAFDLLVFAHPYTYGLFERKYDDEGGKAAERTCRGNTGQLV